MQERREWVAERNEILEFSQSECETNEEKLNCN